MTYQEFVEALIKIEKELTNKLVNDALSADTCEELCDVDDQLRELIAKAKI